jgi:hypothetical protein
LDNFLYGIQSYTNKLLRISSDGASQVLEFTPGRIDSGGVDSTGKYWVAAGGRKWAVIDLQPGSPNYTQIVEQGTADPLGVEPADVSKFLKLIISLFAHFASFNASFECLGWSGSFKKGIKTRGASENCLI